MKKKLLALTLVLVFAAGFAAVAAEHEDDRALTGTWENELYLSPNTGNTFAGYDSVLDVDYTTGGTSYSSKTSLNLSGLTEQEFGVDSSIGLLDLSSTLNMDVSDANLRFWETSADLTLGGVSMGTTFYLQKHDWTYSDDGSYEATFWPEVSAATEPHGFTSLDGVDATQTDSYFVPHEDGWLQFKDGNLVGEPPEYTGEKTLDFHDYGSGLELSFSGETPGGVSVDVTNTFGMMPTSDAEADLTNMLKNKVEAFIEDKNTGSFADVDDFDEDWEEKVSLWDIINELSNGTWNMSNFSAGEAWLASQLDVPAVGEVDLSIASYSGTNQGSDSIDPITIESLVVDLWAYIADKAAGSSYGPNDPEFSVSEEVREAYIDALKASISIYGIAGETGKVVNTEFDLGGAQYDWTITEADADDDTDASVSFGLENVDVGPDTYGGSSLQYYSTLIELDNLSIGCCDFSNETKFTEHDGFQYTKFDFSMEMETFPIDVDAVLKWDNNPDTDDTGKTVTLTPSLSTDWSCFEVYTTLGSDDGDIDSLSIDGFEISAELGHVEVTSITALGDSTVYDLNSDYHAYDEVLAIDKLASAGDLDFGLDYYTNMGSSGSGFMPVALEGTATYPISSQFDLGTGLAWVDDGSVTDPGLQEVSLTFDYSF